MRHWPQRLPQKLKTTTSPRCSERRTLLPPTACKAKSGASLAEKCVATGRRGDEHRPRQRAAEQPVPAGRNNAPRDRPPVAGPKYTLRKLRTAKRRRNARRTLAQRSLQSQ